MAIRLSTAGGGDTGKSVTDLSRCPACATACAGVHVDANFKVRQRKWGARGGAFGLPLEGSIFGELENEHGQLKSVHLSAFRKYRSQLQPSTRKEDDPITCNDARALHESKCAAKGAINGINVGVCRHNVLSEGSAACIDTVSLYLLDVGKTQLVSFVCMINVV